MSGMAIGSMIEADKRLRQHEKNVRAHKQLARDAAVWNSYFAEAAREEERENEKSQKVQGRGQGQGGSGGR